MIMIFTLLRSACSIPTDDNEVIITGGVDTLSTVSLYNINGWIRDLPSLNTGRFVHACGQYKSQNGNTVKFKIQLNTFKILKI